jgi:hypothetical protein
MSDKQHIVYFIGGPEDQAKRVMPGEKPARAWLATAEIDVPRSAYAAQDAMHGSIHRHEYRLFPVPNPAQDRIPVFTAVYVGRLEQGLR